MTHHNVDPTEISKCFEELAARWWDPHSEFRPLHEINPLRLGYIEEQAGGLEGKKALDVGCGGGILAESMAARGAEVTGIDMGESNLEVAKLHLLESGLEVDYRKLPAEKLQASLRSRERFWDIRVPKIDSIFDNSLVPRPSWSPGVPPQHRKLVAATHRSPI